MIGIMLVTHAPLGDALVHCAVHVFSQRPVNLVAVDVVADIDPEALARQLHELLATLDAGDGVLILTDVVGSTPSNIATAAAQGEKAAALSGVNLPMLLRALTYRHLPLEELVEKTLTGGRNSILNTGATAPQQQTHHTGGNADAASRSFDQ